MILKIQKKISEAMRSGNKQLIFVLRDIKNELIAKEKILKNSLSDKEFITVLAKMAKKRKQSIEAYDKGGRSDLSDKEKFELSIIESWLPKQMTEDEITYEIDRIIKVNNFSNMKDMGRVMKLFKTSFDNADGKTVSNIVRSKLV